MDPVDCPELAGVTPEQAWALERDDNLLGSWLGEHGIARPSRRFFSELAMLAWAAQEAAFQAAAQRQAAAALSEANRRRADLAELRELVATTADRLPIILRQVATLCVSEGLSIAEVARELGIARSTVRTHLRRLRAIARRWTLTAARRETPTSLTS